MGMNPSRNTSAPRANAMGSPAIAAAEPITTDVTTASVNVTCT